MERNYGNWKLEIGNSKTTIVKPITKNIYYAVRMGGMGIAIGSIIGQEVADMTEL